MSARAVTSSNASNNSSAAIGVAGDSPRAQRHHAAPAARKVDRDFPVFQRLGVRSAARAVCWCNSGMFHRPSSISCRNRPSVSSRGELQVRRECRIDPQDPLRRIEHRQRLADRLDDDVRIGRARSRRARRATSSSALSAASSWLRLRSSSIGRRELFVGRLQFLLRGLELLVRALKLLVGGQHLLVRRAELLLDGSVLLDRRPHVVAQSLDLALAVGRGGGPSRIRSARWPASACSGPPGGGTRRRTGSGRTAGRPRPRAG